MRSSAAVTFRSLLMVGSAVAIPIIAIVGKPLPDLLWNRVQTGLSVFASATKSTALPQAPRFRPTYDAAMAASPARSIANIPNQGVSDAAADMIQANWSPLPPPKMDESALGTLASPSSMAPIVSRPGDEFLASYRQTAVSLPAHDHSLSPRGNSDDPSHTPLEEVSSRTPIAQLPASAGETGTGDQQFRTIQQRLRQLGATWYALETWGNEGRFHFSCRVAVEGNPSLTRLFQASDAEAFRAMGQVLQQVERWKATP